MDSTRATKRRKLDSLQPKSSPTIPSGSSPTITSRTTPVKRGIALANGTRSASAHNGWTQAKAKTQELRGRKIGQSVQSPKASDVYDDFEGAHAGKSSLQPLAKLTPKSKLDLLRNQASAPPAKSSPAKSGAGLGFFKQFHGPKPQVQESSRKEYTFVVNGAVVEPAGDVAEDKDSEEPEVGDEAQPSPTKQTGKGAWKSWSYQDKKKTFEDEIRDLERAAREKAKNDDGDETPDRAAHRRPRRVVSTPNDAASNGVLVSKKATPMSMPKNDKHLAKRKVNHVLPTEPSTHEAPKDPMEVDQVENELEQQLHSEIGSSTPRATLLKRKLQRSSDKHRQPSMSVSFDADHLQVIQNITLEKLTGKRPIRLTNLDNEYAKVSSMIKQTITAGESNSMLVIGARGSGKTTLVNHILRAQATEHSDDFHVVRLNGFIHTDDKIALREIWRQLGREMDLDEEETTLKNYADTLTSLLALLSLPAEQGREQTDQVTKSVVFILDEFELFANHPRQTLLYNLFDIAQSRKAPITVLGLTTRIDVAESLEKRVKSRFSHRYVHLSSAKSFAAFREGCRVALALDQHDMKHEEQALLAEPGSSKKSVMEDWNTLIEALFTHQDFVDHIQCLYYTTKSLPTFHASMLQPVSGLRADESLAPHSLFPPAITTTEAPNSKLTLLDSLSILHLALLISAARLTNIHNLDTIPFIQAYEEYKTLASKARIQASASGALAQGAGARIWSKGVAKGAWEELRDMGLVIEDSVRGCRVDVGLEEIGWCVSGGVEAGGGGRWCREV